MSLRTWIVLLFFLLTSTIAKPAQLTYSLNIHHALCACNGSVAITITSGTAPYSYNWVSMPTYTNSGITGLCPGTYTCFVMDAVADTVTIFITINDKRFKDTIRAKDGCNNKASAAINLYGGKTPYTYTVLPINISNTLTLTNLSTGHYTLTAKDSTGCALSDTFSVNNYSAVSNFTTSIKTGSIGSVVSTENLSLYASNYFWDFGNSTTSALFNPSVTYSVAGIYTVSLVANFATCYDTSYKVIIITDNLSITIPNVFTPNYDGINDLFTIHSEGALTMHLEIRNRYGVLLFVNDGTGVQWDGRSLSGENIPEGTYFYILEVTDVLNNIKKYNGYVTLLR